MSINKCKITYYYIQKFKNNVFQTMEQPSIINVFVYYNPVETNGAVPAINFNPEGTQHFLTFPISYITQVCKITL